MAAIILVSVVGLGTGVWLLAGQHSVVTPIIACVAVAAILWGSLRLLLFKPLDRALDAARARLGNLEAPSRRNDEVAEIRELVGSLVDVLHAGEEAAAQSWRDLLQLQTQHRQLIQVAGIGQEVNAALPYRETVERALECTKALLRADFVALLRREEDNTLDVESALGVSTVAPETSCRLCRESCPVQRAMNAEALLHTTDHRCALSPHTMRHQLVVPLPVDGSHPLAILATATTGEVLASISDESLMTLRGHLRTALENALKYDTIRRQVVTDHLTGFYNRLYFLRRASEEVERSLRTQTPVSVVLVDIDHFKRFNDSHGHATGDRVIQAVATRLQTALRATDVCARYGGDEFTLLLPNTPGDKAISVANRVRQTLSDTRYAELGLPADAFITLCAGVATCPRDATTVDELLELADRALYQAKEAGRNCVCQASPDDVSPTPGRSCQTARPAA